MSGGLGLAPSPRLRAAPSLPGSRAVNKWRRGPTWQRPPRSPGCGAAGPSPPPVDKLSLVNLLPSLPSLSPFLSVGCAQWLCSIVVSPVGSPLEPGHSGAPRLGLSPPQFLSCSGGAQPTASLAQHPGLCVVGRHYRVFLCLLESCLVSWGD